MAKIDIQKANGNEGISIEGEVIGNFRFDCLNIFSKEYAILHAISEIDRSGFKSGWSEY